MDLAAGAVWAGMIPVASLAAGLSRRPVPDEALTPPALRGGETAVGSPRVMRDVRAKMFEEGLRQIARKAAARQAAGN